MYDYLDCGLYERLHISGTIRARASTCMYLVVFEFGHASYRPVNQLILHIQRNFQARTCSFGVYNNYDQINESLKFTYGSIINLAVI